MDAAARTSGVRFLQNLAYLVPTARGYRDRERRRDEDSRLRMLLLRRLCSLRNDLIDLQERCARSRPDSWAEAVEARTRILEGLADAIRYAPYGFSGFFDADEVTERSLERLLEIDLLLFLDLESIDEAIRTEEIASPPRGRESPLLSHLDAAAAEFEKHLILRDKILGDI